MKKLLAAALLVGLILIGQGTAYAVPILQLYIEGAYFDQDSETWVLIPSEDPPYPGFLGRVWAIGNIDGPGGKGEPGIFGVRLSIAYSKDFAPNILLTPTQVGGSGSYIIPSTSLQFTDDSTPIATFNHKTVTDGTAPVLGDGSSLPAHGIYGPLTDWQEFALGDFTNPDSPVADFTSSFLPDFTSDAAQINAYDVVVSNWSGESLHFDLYNHLEGFNHAKFAPFSHDGDIITPEPASFVVWFLIGLSWAGSAWTYQYRRRWRKWQQEEAAGAASVHRQDQADRFTGLGGQLEEQVGIRPAGRWATHRPSR